MAGDSFSSEAIPGLSQGDALFGGQETSQPIPSSVSKLVTGAPFDPDQHFNALGNQGRDELARRVQEAKAKLDQERAERWAPLDQEITDLVHRDGIGDSLPAIEAKLADGLRVVAEQDDPKGEMLHLLGRLVNAARTGHDNRLQMLDGEHYTKDFADDRWRQSAQSFNKWITNLFVSSL